MELMGSATRLRQGYGVPSIEGKAAPGSSERTQAVSEFQLRRAFFGAFQNRYEDGSQFITFGAQFL
jgi:hypothetical protein